MTHACVYGFAADKQTERNNHITDTQETNADITLRSSQVAPHPSTNRALRCLTSEVRRDPVPSMWYSRQRI